MRLTVFFVLVVVFTSAFSWSVLQVPSLSNTIWTCLAYKQARGVPSAVSYDKSYEQDTIIFHSEGSARLVKKGYYQHIDGKKMNYKVDYTISYSQERELITFNFDRVDILAGSGREVENDFVSMEGVSTAFNYFQENDYLYFWSSENIGNRFVCSKYEE